jgi:hypothetical protein
MSGESAGFGLFTITKNHIHQLPKEITMNTIISIVLLAAILTLAWVIRSVAEKLLKMLGNTNTASSQNEWHGNRVRAAGIGSRKS